jgi:thymidylate synthase (FAD)
MNIKLISYSQQAIEADKQDEFEFDLPNLQDLVAYCARVSNPSNQANSETSEKLIKYLIKTI